jgi:hypothetical protein
MKGLPLIHQQGQLHFFLFYLYLLFMIFLYFP